MKKYKLLKDLPGVKAGTIFIQLQNEDKPCHSRNAVLYAPEGRICPTFIASDIEDKEWFEEVIEWPKTWEELNAITVFYINYNATVKSWTNEKYKFAFPTEKEAKSALAFAQLCQLAKAMNGDWQPNWKEAKEKKWFIYHSKLQLQIDFVQVTQVHIAFQTKEMAEFSLKHHHQLWKDYWMID